MGPLDLFLVLFYFVALFYIGAKASTPSTDADEFFLARRSMPWWAVMFSIYATALSALTFIGVPGAAFAGDFHYLQLAIGDFIGRILICLFLIKAFYAHRVSSIYELLGTRFGPRTHDAATLFFFVSRLLASSVRLCGCALALSIIFDIPAFISIAVICAVVAIYTSMGGIRAVIWTDVMQFFVFTLAAAGTLFLIVSTLPEGWQTFFEEAVAAEKFTVFHFDLALSNPDSVLAGIVLGCLTTFAALGCDQDNVQRMLCCPRPQESQKALFLTAILNTPMTILFLSVGTALFVYYQHFPPPDAAVLAKADGVFPYFIKTAMPAGFKGLAFAGLLAAAMGSLDSALNALAHSFYIDILSRYTKHSFPIEALSKILVIAFSIILGLLALLFVNTASILWLGFKIAGYCYGALLGIFLLAVLTKKRGNDLWNVFAMLTSVVVVAIATSWGEIAWPWSIAIGTAWTFCAAGSFRQLSR